MAFHSIIEKILSAPVGSDRSYLSSQSSTNSDDNISANSEAVDIYNTSSFRTNEQSTEDILIYPTLSSSLVHTSRKNSSESTAPPSKEQEGSSKKAESRDIQRVSSKLPGRMRTRSNVPSNHLHDYDDIPYSHKKIVINNRKVKLTIALLNKTIFLDGNKQKQIPIRGCLILNVKKPTKIHKIELQLHGVSSICFYYKGSPLIQSEKTQEFTFLKDVREWYNFNPNDDQLRGERWDSSDTFSKGSYKFPFMFTTNGNAPQSTYNSFGSVTYRLEAKLLTPKKHTHHLKIVSGRLTLDFVQCTLKVDESDLGHLQNTNYVSTANWRNLLCYSVSISGPTNFAIGSKLNVTVRILPIIRSRYKIHQIRIFMVQKLCYDSIPSNKSHYADIIQTEKLPLLLVNVRNDHGSGHKSYSGKFEILIDSEYYNACSNERFVIYPSTSSTERHMCHFKVRHEFIVGIVVQEIEKAKSKGNDIKVQSSKNNLSSDINLKKSMINSKNIENEEDHFIRSTAALIGEPKADKDRFSRVELLVTKNLHILRSESRIGNEPPPSYLDTKKFAKVSEGSHIHLPSYEEHAMASHILPPTYA